MTKREAILKQAADAGYESNDAYTARRSMQVTNRFNRDARVLAARKAYRVAVNAGIPERQAWDVASAVYTQVRTELGG